MKVFFILVFKNWNCLVGNLRETEKLISMIVWSSNVIIKKTVTFTRKIKVLKKSYQWKSFRGIVVNPFISNVQQKLLFKEIESSFYNNHFQPSESQKSSKHFYSFRTLFYVLIQKKTFFKKRNKCIVPKWQFFNLLKKLGFTRRSHSLFLKRVAVKSKTFVSRKLCNST